MRKDRRQFFIVGVMRCGTTYLATLLDEHPEICMAKPIVPERKFFLRAEEFDKGKAHYESEYFAEKEGIRAFGEKTVHYSEREDAARRIFSWYPDAKIIILLRNPVYRALSNYYFSVKNGLEKRTPEEVFIKKEPPPAYERNTFFISPFAYVERGEYSRQVSLYRKYARKGNLNILLYEEIAGKKKEISNIYQWLGVSAKFEPPSLRRKIFSNETAYGDVGLEIIDRLHDYYLPHNKQLKRETGLPTGVWEKW